MLVEKADNAMHTNPRINFQRYGFRYLKSNNASRNDSLLILDLGVASADLPFGLLDSANGFHFAIEKYEDKLPDCWPTQ